MSDKGECSVNNEVYNKVNSFILNFLNKKDADYAILLNGEWGCGKTYYCDNILSDFLKKKNKYTIRVSLFGKSDFSEIWDDIIFECFNQFDKKLNKFLIKSQEFINNHSLNIEKETKNGSIGFSVATECFSGLVKTLNKHDKRVKEIKDTALIIFDDLERCESGSLMRILGQINFDLIEKGYHILFVANTNEMGENENYKKWKEKIIRNTFTLPFNHNVINSIIFKNKSFSDLIKFNIDFRPFAKINNFRTWLYAFDALVELSEIVDKNNIRIPKDELFYSILLKSYYIRKGEDIRTKTIYDSFFEGFTNANSNQRIGEENNFKSKVSKDFNLGLYKNSQIPFLDLAFLNEYIRTGIFDEEDVCCEIRNYYPDKNVFNDAYYYFSRPGEFERMDQEDYIVHVENLYRGLFERKYKPWQMIHISKYFEEYESQLFEIGALDTEYKEKIKNYLWKNWKSFVNIFDAASKKDIQRINEAFPAFLKDLFEKIKEGASDEKDKNIKNKIKEVFFDDNKAYDYYSLPDEIQNCLFSCLLKYKIFDDLVKIDCSKIFILRSYVKHILEVANAGETYHNELDGLESFEIFLKEKNRQEFINVKSYYYYQSLVEEIEQCRAYINSTTKRECH